MNTTAKTLAAVGICCQANRSLAEHSGFRIGGSAELAVFPESREQLTQALSVLRAAKLRVSIIGNGTNVVFPDEGLDGAVVFTERCRAFSVDGRQITADAGCSLASLAVAAREASLSGLEFAHGIPGTLGGAVRMNAGAYGGCMGDVCISSDCYNMSTGEIHTVCRTEHAFGYRTSIYANHPEYIVLGAALTLQEGEKEEIGERMRELSARRRASQPLEFPSAGSVFKRPEGYFAGKLIEDCGLKGYRIGGAEVSQKHAGFIVNRGDATARDVKTLVAHIRQRVMDETGVLLECEIQFL